MKKKSFLSLLLVSSILFFSCKKELEPQESSGTVTETQTPTAATPNPQDMPETMVTAPLPEGVVATPQQQAPQPVQTAPGMNPPHGQPNHRCDIAVGAPLNSPAAKTTAQTTPAATITKATPSQTIQIDNSQNNNATPAILNPATATATAPGMNPPHGQEGHRCDIAVGAPLPKS